MKFTTKRSRFIERRIKQTSAEYRKAGDEVKEYLIIQENIASIRRDERKMELTRSGSRNRSVKNTSPDICENAGALGFFHFPENKDIEICGS